MLGFASMADPLAHADRTPPSERPSSLLGLLQRRYFRRLWAMTTVLSLGDWIGVFALTIYVKDLSGRPEFAVGGVLLFRVVPGLFFGPLGGVLADRFDRRRLMITADILRAILMGSLPWIRSLPMIYAVSAMMEILSIMWKPAKDAAIPNLVERDQILMANQLNLISTYATFPLGGAFVALLAIPAALLARFDAFSVLREHPVVLAFWVDAATFLYAGVMVMTFPREVMQSPASTEAKDVRWNPFRDLTDGFRFVWENRIVRLLVFGAWVAFTGGSAIVSLGPIFTDRIVAGTNAASQAAWGTLIVAVGIGLVGGMIGAGAVARKIARERIFPLGLMLSGAAAVVVGSMTSLRSAIMATVAVGFGAGIAWVTIFTLLQERTDDRYRGRTFATLYTGIQFSLFLGLAGWPIIAGAVGNRTVIVGATMIDLSGVRVVMIAGGVFLFFSGVWTLRGMRNAIGIVRGPRARGLKLSAVQGAERTGILIAFEGGEGSGKSTQIDRLASWLRERGHSVVVTREPGGSAIGEKIRAMVLDPASTEMDHKTEALLYAAARAQHVVEVIGPALDKGAIVLCDRYLDSSVAYQGIARGIGEDDVLRLNAWATDETIPDLVILLHVDPEIGLKRSAGSDRMEMEDLAFHRKVAEGYLHLAGTYPGRFAVVDAAADPDAVHQQVRAAILPRLSKA